MLCAFHAFMSQHKLQPAQKYIQNVAAQTRSICLFVLTYPPWLSAEHTPQLRLGHRVKQTLQNLPVHA